MAEVIFGFLLLVWLLLIPSHPFLLLGPGVVILQVSPFKLAPVLWQFFWWVVALNVVQLTWHCVDLARGTWQEPRRAQHIVIKVFGLIPLALLLTAPGNVLVVLKNPAVDGAAHGAALRSINHGIHTAVLIIFVIVVLQLIWDLGRMAVEAYRKRAAAMR